MGDEENIDIGSAEVLRHERFVAGENLGHQAAEDDQEDVLVPERVQEPHQRGLSTGAGLTRSLLIHERQAPRSPLQDAADRSALP